MEDSENTLFFPRPTPKLDRIEAHIFLDDVQARLGKRQDVFMKLLGALDMFNNDREIQGLLLRLSRILFPFPDLVDAFNCWFPIGTVFSYDLTREGAMFITSPGFSKSVVCQPQRRPKNTLPTRRSLRIHQIAPQ
ncbi:hypothetical protein FRC20_003950 [Serendipita sp. 405]|nr:hypothetical protein FRC15_003220 [Serendipita sp. 397]KAG8800404.1 hypothetical protein FRC16_002960 [Serendipita sp. 398]KAG8868197.1 hypothetical protein FRC20_003950 [Serendipita sp. 405]